MAKLNKNDVVEIPCSVSDGPFEGEYVVQFETLSGPVSGFAKERNIHKTSRGWAIRGVVMSVGERSITVRVEGSFFTTNGLADFAPEALAA